MALNVILMVVGAVIVYSLTFTQYLGIVTVTPENMSGFWATWRPEELGTIFFFNAFQVIVLICEVGIAIRADLGFVRDPGSAFRAKEVFIISLDSWSRFDGRLDNLCAAIGARFVVSENGDNLSPK